MPKSACAACNAARILCANCAGAKKSPFDSLPIWPGAARGMLPGARQMMGDDDEEEGGDEEEEEKDDDEDDGKGKSKAKGKGKGDDDDDDDDDKPSKGKKGKGKGSRDDSEAPAKAGMGIGMILLIVGALLACCICLPGVGVGIMMVGGMRDAAVRLQSINNAKQIGLAMHSYHDVKKSFPSPRLPKAELSWRIELLPYMDEMPLYNQFDFDKDWDKGKNQPLVNNRPKPYDCPLHPPANNTHTPWLVFIGPGGLFPNGDSKIGFMDMKDGTSNTILFCEGAATVPWSKYADMSVPKTGPPPVPQQGFIAAFGDATARYIDRSKVTDDELKGMINPNDGKLLAPGLN